MEFAKFWSSDRFLFGKVVSFLFFLHLYLGAHRWHISIVRLTSD